jgi:hypothetical protein
MQARRRIAAATIVTILTPLFAHAQPNRGEPVDAGQVLSAIEKGIAYLKRQQGPRGNWPEVLIHNPSGITALCTLALLNAGVEVDDPAMRKALTYLRGQQLDRTYTVALRAMVLCAAEPKKDLVQIGRDVRWLETTQIKEDGPFKGAWGYPGVVGDNSNSQFAILALSDAQRVGVEVKRETWELAHSYWTRTQNADGSWGYVPGNPGDGSMTCAGIGGLAISAAALESGDAAIENGQIECCRPHTSNDGLERAIEWLGERFSVSRNPRSPNRGQPVLYYYLYGLERAGRLTARRFIGEHDWYREGAEFLVRQQDPLSHYWTHSWHAENNEHISTALALLFLSKGRRPVVMAKLKYGEGDSWNQHRRDAAHLSAYAEERWRVGLTWQIIDPAAATVADLLQSPVLYISGRNLPRLIDNAKKLRDYIDRGGFLFAEACCDDSRAFDEGFGRLMTAVFPEPEYQLQRLPPGHPIWRMEEIVRPESPYAGRLWGIEYGCRTSVVYSERDLSCYWELAQPGTWSRYGESARQQIADALAIGVNALTYATNREPKGKEQAFDTVVDGDATLAEGSRGVVEVVKLRHGGGCNDAPGALVNLLRTAGQGETQLRVRAAPEMINISDEKLFQYHLAFMHGRHDFRLTPAERTRLREYVERGGTILADAICASQSFAAAMRRELGEALPGRTISRIPADDPLFTTGYGGFDIRHVTLRDPQPAAENQPVATRTRQIEPQLEGIQIDGRWALIFSPYDISCALESHEAVGCRGYTRQDAARIGLNVLLYSLNQ